MAANYGQIGGLGESRGRGRRTGCITLGLGAALLLVVACVLLAVLVPRGHKQEASDVFVPKSTTAASQLCTGTVNPPLCDTVLSGAPNGSAASPLQLVQFIITNVIQAVEGSLDLLNVTVSSAGPNQLSNATLLAFGDCSELLGNSLDFLGTSTQQLQNLTLAGIEDDAQNVITYLSAAATQFDTCLQGLVEAANPVGTPPSDVSPPTDPYSTSNSTSVLRDLYSIALYFADYINNLAGTNLPADIPKSFSLSDLLNRRRLLEADEEEEEQVDSSQNDQPSWYELPSQLQLQLQLQQTGPSDADAEFPSWMSHGTRRALLQLGTTKANKVVSHGTGFKGSVKTIQAAVNSAPSKSKDLYIIFIDSGIYKEQVTIPKDKQNIAFVGAGIDKTIITWGASVGGGSTTFLSATLAVNGFGFLATSLTIANTAGPYKFQAVALRVSADQSAFYRIKVTGFQDTLYAHTLRQFYRESTIVGTVDFIFGNAAAVFQRCNILASTGILGQQNTLTAQGRTDRGMNTGFSFQSCTIAPTRQLQSQQTNFQTYLGRPWKLYSRTAYLGCTLGNIVNPAGWLPWNGTFALSTLFYGEYHNSGPGAATGGRVKWAIKAMTARQTKKFLMKKLIQGPVWLPATGIPFTRGF